MSKNNKRKKEKQPWKTKQKKEEKSKTNKEKDKNKTIQNEEQQPRCLLWVDDVVLMSDNEKDHKQIIKITEKIANKYRIKFGQAKSKTMIIGKAKETKFEIDKMPLEYTANYKYLGEIINNKINLNDHLTEMERKVEGAYQTIIAVTKNPVIKDIELTTAIKLINTCIMPIITYASETWILKTKTKTKINKLLDDILKRVLKTPKSTPRENLYIETGLIDPETEIIKQKILFYIKKAKNTNDSDFKRLSQNQNPDSWIKDIENIIKEQNINIDYLTTAKKTEIKKAMNILTTQIMTNKITALLDTKQKTRHIACRTEWKIGKTQKYIEHLPSKHASQMFKARNMMMEIKEHTKHQHTDLKCRGCGHATENLDHILNKCKKIHKTEETKIYKNQLYSEDVPEIKTTSKKLNYIMNTIAEWKTEQPHRSQAPNPAGATRSTGNVHVE